MSLRRPIRTGKRGAAVIPALALPVEIYTSERKAEFLLSNAIDAEEYAWAADRVRELGLDPSRVPHRRPPGVPRRKARAR